MRPARYALIGSPVAHSLSPLMQQAAFDAVGIEATYRAIETPPGRAGETMRRLAAEGYRGWNITTPLKGEALAFVARLTTEAAGARALNAVRSERDGSLSGHNTDGAGFLRALRALWGMDVRGAAVLILGSGPAARAISAALRDAGARAIYCWSRNSVKAEEIGPPPAGELDLAVSALPASATVPDDVLASTSAETKVFDLNYRCTTSPVASMPGRLRSDGMPLLLHQGALSFEWWTQQPAPVEAMRAALERASLAP